MPLQWRNQFWQKFGGSAGKHVCDVPDLAFRHLTPNSARAGNATDEAFFVTAQLSTDAVSECLGNNKTVEAK